MGPDIRAVVDADTRLLEQALQKAVAKPYKLNFSVDQGASGALGRIRSQLGEFDKSLAASNARVLAFSASAGAMFAVTKSLKEMVRVTVEVERKMTSINSILGAGRSQFKQFGNDLFKIARDTSTSFEEVTDAAEELARQGVGIEETLKRTSSAMKLAKVSGVEVKTAVDAITAALNSNNDAWLDSEKLINKLVAVDAKFAVSAGGLAEAIKRVGSVASDAGLDIDDLIAAITSAQQTTARGEAVIGNALKTIFTRAQRPKVLEDFEALGIATKDAVGNIRPLARVLTEVAKRYDDLSSAQQQSVSELVGGVYQINILKALFRDLGKETSFFSSALNTSRNATNEADRRVAELNETLDSLFKKLTVNLTQVGSGVGNDVFGPLFKNLLKSANAGLEQVSRDMSGESGQFLGKAFEAIFKGIGNTLNSPILIGGFITLSRFLLQTAKEGREAIKTLAGLNNSLHSLEVVSADAANWLRQNPKYLQDIVVASRSAEGATRALAAATQAYTKFAAERNAVDSKFTEIGGVLARGSGLVSIPTRGVERIQPKKAAVGLIPQAQEMAGAYAGGYKPGQVKDMNVPGMGRVYYNTAEKVKWFPGMGQPAIMPPQGSRAGRDYERDFAERHGFNPYAAQGMIPNFLDTSFLKLINKVTSAPIKIRRPEKGGVFTDSWGRKVGGYAEGVEKGVTISGKDNYKTLAHEWGHNVVDGLGIRPTLQNLSYAKYFDTIIKKEQLRNSPHIEGKLKTGLYDFQDLLEENMVDFGSTDRSHHTERRFILKGLGLGDKELDILSRVSKILEKKAKQKLSPTPKLAGGLVPNFAKKDLIQRIGRKEIFNRFSKHYGRGKDYESFYKIHGEEFNRKNLTPEEAKIYANITSAISPSVPDYVAAQFASPIFNKYLQTKSTNVDDYLDLPPTRKVSRHKNVSSLGLFGIKGTLSSSGNIRTRDDARRAGLSKALSGLDLGSDDTAKTRHYARGILQDKTAFPIDINVIQAILGGKRPSKKEAAKLISLANEFAELNQIASGASGLQAAIFKSNSSHREKYSEQSVRSALSGIQRMSGGFVPNFTSRIVGSGKNLFITSLYDALSGEFGGGPEYPFVRKGKAAAFLSQSKTTEMIKMIRPYVESGGNVIFGPHVGGDPIEGIKGNKFIHDRIHEKLPYLKDETSGVSTKKLGKLFLEYKKKIDAKSGGVRGRGLKTLRDIISPFIEPDILDFYQKNPEFGGSVSRLVKLGPESLAATPSDHHLYPHAIAGQPLGRINPVNIEGLFARAGNLDKKQISKLFGLVRIPRIPIGIAFNEGDETHKSLGFANSGLVPNFAQSITSADTSIKQIPGLFKKFGKQLGPLNIDIGGGKFDLGTDYLNSLGIKSRVYDPFNRSKEFNDETLANFFGKADSATIANVLNVIKEPDARKDLLEFIRKSVKQGGSSYFGIYEGNKSGIGAITSKGFQNNLPAGAYIDEISEFFNIKKKVSNYIIGSPKFNGFVPNFALNEKAFLHYSKKIPNRLTNDIIDDWSGHGHWDSMYDKRNPFVFRGTNFEELKTLLKEGSFQSSWSSYPKNERGTFVSSNIRYAVKFADPILLALRRNIVGKNPFDRIRTISHPMGETSINQALRNPIKDSDLRAVFNVRRDEYGKISSIDPYSLDSLLEIAGKKDTFINQGLIPNFSPLSAAISRESAAVNPGLIRVGSHSALRGPGNPDGVGVYNLRDEPLGLGQGVERARAMGLNPKTHGIPNYASKWEQRKERFAKDFFGDASSPEPGNKFMYAMGASMAGPMISTMAGGGRTSKIAEEATNALSLYFTLSTFLRGSKGGKVAVGAAAISGIFGAAKQFTNSFNTLDTEIQVLKDNIQKASGGLNKYATTLEQLQESYLNNNVSAEKIGKLQAKLAESLSQLPAELRGQLIGAKSGGQVQEIIGRYTESQDSKLREKEFAMGLSTLLNEQSILRRGSLLGFGESGTKSGKEKLDAIADSLLSSLSESGLKKIGGAAGLGSGGLLSVLGAAGMSGSTLTQLSRVNPDELKAIQARMVGEQGSRESDVQKFKALAPQRQREIEQAQTLEKRMKGARDVIRQTFEQIGQFANMRATMMGRRGIMNAAGIGEQIQGMAGLIGETGSPAQAAMANYKAQIAANQIQAASGISGVFGGLRGGISTLFSNTDLSRMGDIPARMRAGQGSLMNILGGSSVSGIGEGAISLFKSLGKDDDVAEIKKLMADSNEKLVEIYQTLEEQNKLAEIQKNIALQRAEFERTLKVGGGLGSFMDRGVKMQQLSDIYTGKFGVQTGIFKGQGSIDLLKSFLGAGGQAGAPGFSKLLGVATEARAQDIISSQKDLNRAFQGTGLSLGVPSLADARKIAETQIAAELKTGDSAMEKQMAQLQAALANTLSSSMGGQFNNAAQVFANVLAGSSTFIELNSTIDSTQQVLQNLDKTLKSLQGGGGYGAVTRAGGNIPISAAATEKMMAKAGGYNPGYIRRAGNLIYNSAERVDYLPGVREPIISPPPGSLAGFLHKQNLNAAFGFAAEGDFLSSLSQKDFAKWMESASKEDLTKVIGSSRSDYYNALIRKPEFRSSPPVFSMEQKAAAYTRMKELALKMQDFGSESSGWVRSQFGEKLSNVSEVHKGYVTFKNFEDFTPEKLEKFQMRLNESKFSGQVKIPRAMPFAADRFLGSFDNIVYHGKSKIDVDNAEKIAREIFGEKGVAHARGFDTGGLSHSESLAKSVGVARAKNMREAKLKPSILGMPSSLKPVSLPSSPTPVEPPTLNRPANVIPPPPPIKPPVAASASPELPFNNPKGFKSGVGTPSMGNIDPKMAAFWANYSVDAKTGTYRNKKTGKFISHREANELMGRKIFYMPDAPVQTTPPGQEWKVKRQNVAGPFIADLRGGISQKSGLIPFPSSPVQMLDYSHQGNPYLMNRVRVNPFAIAPTGLPPALPPVPANFRNQPISSPSAGMTMPSIRPIGLPVDRFPYKPSSPLKMAPTPITGINFANELNLGHGEYYNLGSDVRAYDSPGMSPIELEKTQRGSGGKVDVSFRDFNTKFAEPAKMAKKPWQPYYKKPQLVKDFIGPTLPGQAREPRVIEAFQREKANQRATEFWKQYQLSQSQGATEQQALKQAQESIAKKGFNTPDRLYGGGMPGQAYAQRNFRADVAQSLKNIPTSGLGKNILGAAKSGMKGLAGPFSLALSLADVGYDFFNPHMVDKARGGTRLKLFGTDYGQVGEKYLGEQYGMIDNFENMPTFAAPGKGSLYGTAFGMAADPIALTKHFGLRGNVFDLMESEGDVAVSQKRLALSQAKKLEARAKKGDKMAAAQLKMLRGDIAGDYQARRSGVMEMISLNARTPNEQPSPSIAQLNEAYHIRNKSTMADKTLAVERATSKYETPLEKIGSLRSNLKAMSAGHAYRPAFEKDLENRSVQYNADIIAKMFGINDPKQLQRLSVGVRAAMERGDLQGYVKSFGKPVAQPAAATEKSEKQAAGAKTELNVNVNMGGNLGIKSNNVQFSEEQQLIINDLIAQVAKGLRSEIDAIVKNMPHQRSDVANVRNPVATS